MYHSLLYDYVLFFYPNLFELSSDYLEGVLVLELFFILKQHFDFGTLAYRIFQARNDTHQLIDTSRIGYVPFPMQH